jgi:hypothetical protein
MPYSVYLERRVLDAVSGSLYMGKMYLINKKMWTILWTTIQGKNHCKRFVTSTVINEETVLSMHACMCKHAVYDMGVVNFECFVKR